jgi:F0F1-type ATP synthase epsilon subunit
MENPEQKAFHCDVIDPTGRLLDCQTTSVVLPAHDGQIGILYNHLPMLCQLGLGIMKVAQPDIAGVGLRIGGSGSPPNPQSAMPNLQSDVFFFVDGGFALVASNSVMVVAYNAFVLHGLILEKVESMIERTAKSLPDAALSASQRLHENERLRALRRIAESLKP